MMHGSAKNRADVVAILRDVLRSAAIETEDLELDEFGWQLLDMAAEACATSLILDAQMKRGNPLSPRQADAYTSALKVQGACFRALGVEDPYAQHGQMGGRA